MQHTKARKIPKRNILTTVKEQLKPEHCALLVIDMQNDFCHENGIFNLLEVADLSMVEKMVPNLLRLLMAAGQAGVSKYFIQTLGDEYHLKEPMIERRMRLGRPSNSCQEGTWGAEFFKPISPAPSDTVITKYEYSCFIDTQLKTLLRKSKIKTLVITGVLTNVCVESTARHGFMLGFYIIVPSDCVAAYDREAHIGSLTNIDNFFGRRVSSNDIIRSWNSMLQ